MSTTDKRNILLIDLPTFPKGVISLSLLSVADCLSEKYIVSIDDLSLIDYKNYSPLVENVVMYGLKVSSQNVNFAIDLSQKLKEVNPSAVIVWGGELPSLLPDYCLQYADTIVGGLFIATAQVFMNDLEIGTLQKKYFGENTKENLLAKVDFRLISDCSSYSQFMGYPLETSRGCTEKCIFCMVHTMQRKHYHLDTIDFLKIFIDQYKGKFINIVDYNFGVDTVHVIEVSKIINASGAIGWMAEMCIDLLDNDEMLQHMKESHCKMIYCGLESIDQLSLNSIHKMNTNHIQNYERIIRKVQSYGIQIAAGIIVGLEGTHKKTFSDLFDFYQRMGIIYAKLTFLTYNPGTKVYEYEKKKGVYVTNNIECYDGNQLTFLPNGVDALYLAEGTEWFIKKYYSILGIVSRSFNTQLTLLSRIEFILFNLCYREVYLKWLKHNTLLEPKNLEELIAKPFRKSRFIQMVEKTLSWVRKSQIKH